MTFPQILDNITNQFSQERGLMAEWITLAIFILLIGIVVGWIVIANFPLMESEDESEALWTRAAEEGDSGTFGFHGSDK